MAKKTAAQNNRRAVIDDIRKKQKGAEKRRGYAIVGVCTLIAILIVGAAAYQPVKDWWDERQFDAVNLADIGAAASVCGEESYEASEGSTHVATGTQVTYNHAPPATGNHWNESGVAPLPMAKKFYGTEDRPELEQIVHNSEHGYNIIWYDETVAQDADEMSELRAIAAKFPGDSNFRYKMLVVPWLASDAEEVGSTFPDGQHIAFTHWSVDQTYIDKLTLAEGETAPDAVGIYQYCSEVSGAAFKTFMKNHPYTDSSEPAAM
ncbi:DUF3105 domain-containing protein [Nocardioides sp.]|uniref:DUF3105 domain-containing protein n=1 Tax=Nocardioides sp. TaxID=35761 RepID=UPI0039E2CBA0